MPEVDYGYMNAAQIAIWLLIATGAGFAGRALVKGKKFLGLWGDAAIGLIGIFLVGTLLRAFDFNLKGWLDGSLPTSMHDYTLWLDIAITGLVGAIIIRAILRPFTGSGG
jgi:uncharacterized membrane protein YeaQ/YmgE (transglycosylase-associated protein family)